MKAMSLDDRLRAIKHLLEHSPYGGSILERVFHCPGSVRLSLDVDPQKASAFAEEGTFAHEVAEYHEVMGEWLPTAPQEMREHLQVWLDAIRDRCEPGDEIWIEITFYAPEISEFLWGTADYVIYNRRTKRLYVLDLKYGKGKVVEVGTVESPNLQTMLYALLVILNLDVEIEEVVLVVCQPRYDHEDGWVRELALPVERITVQFRADLEAAIARTKPDDAPVVAGEWCRWCPVGGAGKCPVAKEATALVVAAAFTDEAPETLQNEELAEILEKIPTVKAYIKAIEKYAYGELIHGRPVPGRKLIAGRKYRTWKAGVKNTSFLAPCSLSAFDVMDSKLKSPAQVEKLLAKSPTAKKALKELIEERPTGYRMVPEKHPGKAVVPEDPRAAFSDVDDDDDDVFG